MNSELENVADALARYRDAAAGTGEREPKKANEWHNKMHACFKLLRETEAGRRGITSLISDRDPHVRCWAAAHSLQWAPEIARRVLEELRNRDEECGFAPR